MRKLNLSEQSKEPTTNSFHIWRPRWDLNPSNIVCYPYSCKDVKNYSCTGFANSFKQLRRMIKKGISYLYLSFNVQKVRLLISKDFLSLAFQYRNKIAFLPTGLTDLKDTLKSCSHNPCRNKSGCRDKNTEFSRDFGLWYRN